MSYHKVTIVGNVGKNPEMRYTPDGTAVTSFSVATSEYAGAGNPKQTIWWKVTTWRKQAETAAEWVKKGGQILVEGKVAPDKATGGPRVWVAQDGTSKASYEITADRFVLLGSKSDNAEEQSAAKPATRVSSQVAEEDEIPF